MKRDKWKFEYQAKRLATAAMDKRDHHAKRETFWEDKKAGVMASLREQGITVTESLAIEYSSIGAAIGPQVTVREDFKRALTECHQKIKEHAAAVRDYDGWQQFLSANPDATMKLDQSDWLFFFGA